MKRSEFGTVGQTPDHLTLAVRNRPRSIGILPMAHVSRRILRLREFPRSRCQMNLPVACHSERSSARGEGGRNGVEESRGITTSDVIASSAGSLHSAALRSG
jgi:hypothetical protein